MTHVSQIAGASRAAKGFVFVKMTQQVRSDELRGLRRFRDDYPQATAFFVYAGSRRRHDARIVDRTRRGRPWRTRPDDRM